MCKDGVRKTKDTWELNLASDTESYKKGFYRHVGQKKKVKEGITPW